MKNMQSFDLETFKTKAASRIKKGETLLGRDGLFTLLLKEFLEVAMNGEHFRCSIHAQTYEPNCSRCYHY